MLRASCSHLPPIAAAASSPTLLVFTSSLHKLSSSSTSSSPSSASSSSIAIPNPYIINPLFINSPQSLHSSHFKRLSLLSSSNMASSLHRCRNATASFSTGSSSEAGKEILVQHLLVKESDLQLLIDLQKRVSEGEDLSDLAVEYSMCPSKEEGGMLGWVRKGQMVPEFEEASFSAPLNKVVRCKTKFGWHLLQVLSQREEPMLTDIQPNELHVKMQDPSFMEEAQLIDVREPEEVEKASLPSFHVLPLRQFGNWGPEIATKFDPSKDTYVLCHHGMRSLQVAKWLQTQGFRKVFNVAGGIHEYAVSVDPSIPTY